jgi:hypothetical protein
MYKKWLHDSLTAVAYIRLTNHLWPSQSFVAHRAARGTELYLTVIGRRAGADLMVVGVNTDL